MTISTFQRAALAAAVAALFCGAAIAQQSDTQSSQPTPSGMARSSSAGKGESSSLTHADRSFIEHAARGGIAEVEIGQLASSKASNDQVKQFAQRMVESTSSARRTTSSSRSRRKKAWTCPTPRRTAINAPLSRWRGNPARISTRRIWATW
jgi:putative membrane protein